MAIITYPDKQYVGNRQLPTWIRMVQKTYAVPDSATKVTPTVSATSYQVLKFQPLVAIHQFYLMKQLSQLLSEMQARRRLFQVMNTIAPDGAVTFTPDKCLKLVGKPDPITRNVDKNGT